MPVREVREIVGTADLDERGALISRHLGRLEHELDQTWPVFRTSA
jgi:hypothetical protein